MTTTDRPDGEATAVALETAVGETATAPAYTCRVFRYGGQSFPDPGAAYSSEDVRRHLQTFLPELGHARSEEKLLPDGTLEVTFSKQVTRKGAGGGDG